ncbi:hypothetical protein [Chryseobacterium foetidum]|uniref:hypothetical protein n=1 Tax=Chryseobacterium foetidum TaxID=2951057 RepID=UPI0021C9C69F|nr:hypothetical protein [Chryseobacterium foetidum]
MKKHLVFISTFILFLASCQKEATSTQKNNQKDHTSMDNEITTLKKQLEKGVKATIGDAVDYQIEYSDDDLKIEEQLLTEILKKHGFKSLNNEEFKIKIKSIFTREIDYSSNKEFIYINNFSKCSRDPIYFKNNVIDFDGNFIFKHNKFIAPLLAIPELIDYEKKYPAIIDYEKMLSTEYLNKSGDKIKIKKWRNESKLMQQRNLTIQTTVARNKYLFNDSKADFTWLKFNDKPFLESLVKIHGYYNDEDLNKFVLEKNSSNLDELGKVLWIEKCDGKFNINQKLFDVISKSSEEDKTKYLNAISEYLSKKVNSNSSDFDNKFSNKAEVLGKIAYFCTKVVSKKNRDYDFFSILGSDDGGKKYEEEFKKNNFYGISDFKQFWDDTKTGGITYPGME